MLFVDKKVKSIYLGTEIKQLKSNDIFVIDIAMLSALEEQAFVIGDVMKTIDETYSLRSNTSLIDISDHKSQNFKNKNLSQITTASIKKDKIMRIRIKLTTI